MLLLLFISTIDNGLDSFKINITEVVSPEVLERDSDITKVVVVEVLVNILNGLVESRKNPLVDKQKRFVIEISIVSKVSRNAHKTKLSALPNLVAEFSVTNNLLDVEVDRSGLLHVGK